VIDIVVSKHDTLVDVIAEELKQRGYEHIHKHVEYKTRRKKGEIDLYTEHKHYVLLFEVKTNYTKKNYCKAKAQLTRAEKYYFNKSQRVFKFYVCNLNEPYIKRII
jgi:Holliday junction resolvase-like predicted endonuclease